jgi:hypothetical protein
LEPDTDRESDAKPRYTGVHCLDIIFKRGTCQPYLLS